MGRPKRSWKIQSKTKLLIHKLSESNLTSATIHQHASVQLFLFLPILQGKRYLHRGRDGNISFRLQKPLGRPGGWIPLNGRRVHPIYDRLPPDKTAFLRNFHRNCPDLPLAVHRRTVRIRASGCQIRAIQTAGLPWNADPFVADHKFGNFAWSEIFDLWGGGRQYCDVGDQCEVGGGR